MGLIHSINAMTTQMGASYVGWSTAGDCSGVVAITQIKGTDTYARFITGDGTTQESSTSAVDLFDDAWHDIRVYRDPDDDAWVGVIDGVEIGRHSTNVPSSSGVTATSRGMMPHVTLRAHTTGSFPVGAEKMRWLQSYYNCYANGQISTT